MKITIKTTNLDITPAIQEYTEKRAQILEKFFRANSDTALAAIELALTTGHHKSGDIFRAELNLSNTATGEQLYAEAEAKDLYTAIDDMKDKAERECLSLKNKRVGMVKRGAARLKKMLRYRG
ncbi:MAG: ribosome-associated translation inhibitor RaiA [Candidatus Parcubacteria bacterium]|nr:ribosome-associated translation inhibitor RaiA [Candidatus Parcubacteria bacterium]